MKGKEGRDGMIGEFRQAHLQSHYTEVHGEGDQGHQDAKQQTEEPVVSNSVQNVVLPPTVEDIALN